MLDRLLVTGARGGLASLVRGRLSGIARSVRLSDRVEPDDLASHEESASCDLTDRAGLARLVEGCDGILHLGGVSVEDRYEAIRDANIDGVYNLYEAARAAGRPRIVFASSNHAIGFYRQDERLDAKATPRPDTLYGVSKCFGEVLASMYHDKFGQETAIVRIGSCFAEPKDHRMLSTWMSPEDFVGLLDRVFTVPRLGCPVVYGASDNDACWWDNHLSTYLGWRPRDNSQSHRDRIDATQDRPAADAVDAVYQGGKFVAEPIHGASG